MAETQLSTLGYMGEMKLHNGTTLVELQKVISIQIPGAGTREQIESTHLKSAGWRREYLSGFYEDSDFEVGLNTRALSDTDVLLADHLGDADVRAFSVGIPENGVLVAKLTGTAKCIGYDRGTMTPDEVLQGTATFRVVTVTDVAEY